MRKERRMKREGKEAEGDGEGEWKKKKRQMSSITS